MKEWLESRAGQLGIQLDQTAISRLELYRQLLVSWNERINLTSIVETAAVYELHFLDSLSVQLAVDLGQVRTLVDVGTGAGFPGVVLAIAFPELKVTLLDATEKKVNFLRLLSQELGLAERVQAVCLRAEQAGQTKGLRDSFQVAVSRGVAQLPVLAEYCLPLVMPGGCFVAMKGPEVQDELEQARSALTRLGGGEPVLVDWILPGGAGRSLVRVPKITATPSGYPRRVGLPAKRPLG